jgi:tyrosyl-tRNA synthetase
MKDFIEELKWRGMFHQSTSKVDDIFKDDKIIKAYIGFDPTSDSLGIGNLAQIMTLLHFQKCGHKPIVLIGGATGMVGDPSGKSKERNLLSKEVLDKNILGQRKQLEKFLNFDCGENSAVIVNNLDWFKDISFLDFIRDIGKHFTISHMISKESVQSRMDSGISFTEFSYQLIQGFDFFHLYKENEVTLQMGGSDQWGNITTGTELIRKAGGEAHGITTHLIKKSDGTKFGKTEAGNVWLDPKKTSPYTFFQFWLNSSDEDITNWIKVFSLKSKEEIESLINEHNQNKELRILQKSLTNEITEMVHGKRELVKCQKLSDILFKKDFESLNKLTIRELDDLSNGMNKFIIPKSFIKDISLLDLLVTTGAFESKSKVKQLVQGGGLSVNMNKCSDVNALVRKEFLKNKFLFVRKGKNDDKIFILK